MSRGPLCRPPAWRRHLTSLSVLLLTATLPQNPVHAQEQKTLNYEDYPSLRLRALDKVTARSVTFDAAIGATLKFSNIYIKILACRKPPPVEKQEAAAFLQIWEVDTTQQKSRWIYSGWTFASSPALSGMDHPVYDVWLIDCLGKDPEELPPPEVPVAGALPDEGTVPENSVNQPDLQPPANSDSTPETPAAPPAAQSPPNPTAAQAPDAAETADVPQTTPDKPDDTDGDNEFNGIY